MECACGKLITVRNCSCNFIPDQSHIARTVLMAVLVKRDFCCWNILLFFISLTIFFLFLSLPSYIFSFQHILFYCFCEQYQHVDCGPGSSVCIATDYRLDGPGSNPFIFYPLHHLLCSFFVLVSEY